MDVVVVESSLEACNLFNFKVENFSTKYLSVPLSYAVPKLKILDMNL